MASIQRSDMVLSLLMFCMVSGMIYQAQVMRNNQNKMIEEVKVISLN